MRAGIESAPVQQFHLYELEWVFHTIVPRQYSWVWKDYFLTEEQAHRHITSMMGPHDSVEWQA